MKRRMALPIIIGLLGCNPLPQNSSEINSVIGEDTQVEVDENASVLPEFLRGKLGAIGVTNNDCTVFHVGNGIAVSAGHCFSDQQQSADINPCEYAWIKWNYRKGHVDHRNISRCIEIVARQKSHEADYAIIRVDPAPAVAVEVGFPNLPDGNDLHGVLGHPGGDLMKWSEGCVLVAGGPSGWGAKEFAHDCDTREGNSGSPVFRLATGEVVGIHDGGDAGSNYGTPLSETPLAEIMAAGRPPYIITDGEEREFGPFEHNRRDLLAVLGRERGQLVSFGLELDVEKDYDQVLLQDGRGVQRNLSGQVRQNFENLTTPVVIIFVSDYAGNSQFVRIGEVRYR